MRVFAALACACLSAGLLVACGGGGGGGGGGSSSGATSSGASGSSSSASSVAQLIVSPAFIDVAATEGVSSSLTLQIARAAGTTTVGYIIVEPVQVSVPAPVLASRDVVATGTGPTQSAALTFKELGIGVYTGKIKVAICANYLPCGPLPGFPEYVPYRITVTAAAGSGSSSSSSGSVGAFKVTPASLTVSAAAGQSVTVPMRVIRAPGTTAEGVITLPPGTDPVVTGSGSYTDAGLQMQSVSFRANTPGVYTGNVIVALCNFYLCTGETPIVQQLVPYTFTVTAAPI